MRLTWRVQDLVPPPLSCRCGTAAECCRCRLSPSSPGSSSSPETETEIAIPPIFNLRVRRIRIPGPANERERKKKVFVRCFIGRVCRQSLTTSNRRCQHKDNFHPLSVELFRFKSLLRNNVDACHLRIRFEFFIVFFIWVVVFTILVYRVRLSRNRKLELRHITFSILSLIVFQV